MLIRQELDDLIFYGQWINLYDQSQNGPRPVTNAWIDWFHIFIIFVNTNSIVMWVILPNNADWDCFKTLTSQEILTIRNRLLEEHCAYSEVIHFSNKVDVQETNYCFSQLNRIWNNLFGHWTEIGWFACSGITGLFLFLEMFLVFQIDRGNLIMMFINVISLKRRSMWWKTLILFPQMSNLRVKKLYCMCLRTMKLWSRWSLKEGVLQWDTSPGLRVALDWLFDRINLDSKIHIKYIDTKNQLADILT